MTGETLEERIGRLEQIIVDTCNAVSPPVGSETVLTKGSKLAGLVGELREDRDRWRRTLANEVALKEAAYDEITETERRLATALNDLQAVVVFADEQRRACGCWPHRGTVAPCDACLAFDAILTKAGVWSGG